MRNNLAIGGFINKPSLKTVAKPPDFREQLHRQTKHKTRRPRDKMPIALQGGPRK